PGIGMENEGATKALRRERRDHQPRIVNKEPHIRELMLFHFRQKMRDPRLEDLAADEAAIGIRSGMKSQMLAGAEADLEPDLADRLVEEAARIQRRAALWQGQTKLRQQRLEQSALSDAQRTAAPAAVKPPLWRIRTRACARHGRGHRHGQ